MSKPQFQKQNKKVENWQLSLTLELSSRKWGLVLYVILAFKSWGQVLKIYRGISFLCWLFAWNSTKMHKLLFSKTNITKITLIRRGTLYVFKGGYVTQNFNPRKYNLLHESPENIKKIYEIWHI